MEPYFVAHIIDQAIMKKYDILKVFVLAAFIVTPPPGR